MDQELRGAYEDLLSAISKMHYLSRLTRHLVKGVTPVEMRVLVFVMFSTERGEEVRPSLLSSHLGTTKSALSQVLRSLEEKALITRNRSEKDSRAVVVELTPKGRESLVAIRSECDKGMSELVSYIGIEDLRYLKQTGDRITDFYRGKADERGLEPKDVPEDALLPIPPIPLCGGTEQRRSITGSHRDGGSCQTETSYRDGSPQSGGDGVSCA